MERHSYTGYTVTLNATRTHTLTYNSFIISPLHG